MCGTLLDLVWTGIVPNSNKFVCSCTLSSRNKSKIPIKRYPFWKCIECSLGCYIDSKNLFIHVPIQPQMDFIAEDDFSMKSRFSVNKPLSMLVKGHCKIDWINEGLEDPIKLDIKTTLANTRMNEIKTVRWHIKTGMLITRIHFNSWTFARFI